MNACITTIKNLGIELLSCAFSAVFYVAPVEDLLLVANCTSWQSSLQLLQFSKFSCVLSRKISREAFLNWVSILYCFQPTGAELCNSFGGKLIAFRYEEKLVFLEFT